MNIKNRVEEVYRPLINAFFTQLKGLEIDEELLKQIPSLFLPCWGENYENARCKIVIAGKETRHWSTGNSDSLLSDLKLYEAGKYNVLAQNDEYRNDGPAEWQNNFWQYAATVLSVVNGCCKEEILSKDSKYLDNIGWFNSHAIETLDSASYKDKKIPYEIMAKIQKKADESGISDFSVLIEALHPDVIFYFYRNQNMIPNRNFPEGTECVRSYGRDNAVMEWRMWQTTVYQMRHPSWMCRGNMSQDELAEIVKDIFTDHRDDECALKKSFDKVVVCNAGKAKLYDSQTMSALEWMRWVEFVRGNADNTKMEDNAELAREMIHCVAQELKSENALMTAQTLIMLLNEIDRFRQGRWLYSTERRGPCSVVRGAWNEFVRQNKEVEARKIAESFTKLDGNYAFN